MPGSHGEITVVEQNRVVNNNNKETRKKKKEDDAENRNQSVTPSTSKPRKGFSDRFRKKRKSSSGECKGGCFSVMRPRRTEEKEEEGSLSCSPLSDPNDECFTLRVMLEKNDFFSDECNPHR